MKKLSLLLLLALLLLASVAIYNYVHYVTGSSPTTSSEQPARLRVSHLGIDAPVMSVGQTASGEMDGGRPRPGRSPDARSHAGRR